MAKNQLITGSDATAVRRLQESTMQLPPFLFRSFSVECSRGVNNSNEMRPIPTRGLPRQSIFAQPIGDIRAMLRAHLLWDYGQESNFISWSSSILWVLEHAARMHTFENKTNVYVAVMDVRKIPDMAIFPATALMETYRIPEAGDRKVSKLQRHYYTSEYLFYGPLINSGRDPCYIAARWDSLCMADLHDVLREFSARSQSDPQLLLRIGFLRSSFEERNVAVNSRNILPALVMIGSLFGREFLLVVVVALMTALHGQQTPATTDIWRDLCCLQIPRPYDAQSCYEHCPCTRKD